MRFLELYLWIAPHLLLGVVLAVFLRRRLLNRLPFFFSYLVFEVTLFGVLITINFLPWTSIKQYYWAAAVGVGISALLKYGVIWESADELLFSRSRLAESLRPWIARIGGGALLVAAGSAATFSIRGIDRARSVFHVLDFCSSFVLLSLLVLLVVFAATLRISWHTRTLGIVLGFAIFACVELATSALRPQLSRSGSVVIDLLQMAAYHLSVPIWLVYLYLPERTPQFTGSGLQQPDLELWNQELERIVRQ